MDEATRIEIERLRDENTRQNHRIEALEQNAEIQQKIAVSVERLAINMEQMLKEQEKQGERLTLLEQDPANRWKDMTKTIYNTVIGAIAGALATGIIYAITNFMK